MIARRRRPANPFSLFSFQDIVTSVTAIVLLITLTLSVELLSRRPIAADETDSRAHEDVESIKASIAECEREIRELEAKLNATLELSAEAAGLTLEQLDRRCEAVLAEIDRLTLEEKELIETQNALAEEEKRAIERRISSQEEQQLKAMSEGTEKSHARADDLRKTAADARQKLARLIANNSLVFNKSNVNGKQPWLIDMSANSWTVVSLSSPDGPVRFSEAMLTFRQLALLAWARRRMPAREYFILLVRPSAADAFDSVSSSLRELGFEIGFDVIGEDQIINVVGNRESSL